MMTTKESRYWWMQHVCEMADVLNAERQAHKQTREMRDELAQRLSALQYIAQGYLDQSEHPESGHSRMVASELRQTDALVTRYNEQRAKERQT